MSSCESGCVENSVHQQNSGAFGLQLCREFGEYLENTNQLHLSIYQAVSRVFDVTDHTFIYLSICLQVCREFYN